MPFDPNWINAFASIAMVIVTVAYVWVAKKSLEASNRAIAQMAESDLMRDRPYITISQITPPGSVSIFLVVENTGKSAASKLRLELDEDFSPFPTLQTDIRPLSKVEIFQREVATFSPGTRMTFLLGSFKVFPPKHLQEHPEKFRFQIHASYEYAGKQFSETTQIDLTIWRGGEIEHPPLLDRLEKIANEISDANCVLERIANSLKSSESE